MLAATKQDRRARRAWQENDKIEIYSVSRNEWLVGVILRVELADRAMDDKFEISYNDGQCVKSLRRNSEDLRVYIEKLAKAGRRFTGVTCDLPGAVDVHSNSLKSELDWTEDRPRRGSHPDMRGSRRQYHNSVEFNDDIEFKRDSRNPRESRGARERHEKKWYDVGQPVDVYSNSQRKWFPASVEKLTVETGGIFALVVFGPNNDLEKELSIDSKDLRPSRNNNQRTQYAQTPRRSTKGGILKRAQTWYSKGKPVEIFSRSNKKWFKGFVEKVTNEGSKTYILVYFGQNGKLEKEIEIGSQDVRPDNGQRNQRNNRTQFHR